ncbi:MAG: endonuclease MutS2 [Ignavibacteria bacterium]|jgi:DNA mismatch repair protein MutS2
MINSKVLEKLEFRKILEFISKYIYTELGKKRIFQTIPFPDKNETLLQGSYVTEAKDILINNDSPPLTYIPNLVDALTSISIEGVILSDKEILDILLLAETSRKLYQFLSTRAEDTSLSKGFLDKLFVDKTFEHHISSIFTDTGEVRDNASPKLKEIRNDIVSKSNQLRKVVNRLLKQLSDSYLTQDDYMTLRDGRIVLPIKAEHKRHVKGFVHSESNTGQTVYIEPEETLELNNDILSLSFAEKREIERILKQLTKKISTVKNELKSSLLAIAEIDAVFANAHFSIEIIGSFPSFDEDKPVNLIDGKHPVLIKKIGRQKTVPLNVKVDKNNTIVITGPNAGGKTVVLKTFGILNLMAQCGIHIPAHPDTNLKFIDNILIDIGDQQSIEDDLSTFSSHLSNIKNILKECNDKSLVLLDEIGTGTDPTEGSALAAAILIILQKSGAITLATTHHGSLKVIANDLEGFENASMEFDTENLKPTYVFNQGLPGSSYAFEVAGRIGFENDFLTLAREYLDEKKSRLEDLLLNLENKSRQLQIKLKESELENTRLAGLTNLYKSKIDELEKSKKKILQEAKEKADHYLRDINKKVESTIKTIKETKADKTVIKEEKKKINELFETHKKISKQIEAVEERGDRDFEIGDYVGIKNTSTFGVIEELDKNKKKAVVISGTLRLNVKTKDLLHSKKVKEETVSHRSFSSYSPRVESFRLDIRGKKPEEAEYEILRFLDDSYASSLNSVEILHGKGTGMLKKTVHDILKKNNVVKDYYFAKIEMGGEGITVVEFN